MQLKLISLLSLLTLTFSSPILERDYIPGEGEIETIPASKCLDMPLMCCQQGGASNTPEFRRIWKKLGYDLMLDVLMGTDCVALPECVVGGTLECNANAYCCKESFETISIDCTPVLLNT